MKPGPLLEAEFDPPFTAQTGTTVTVECLKAVSLGKAGRVGLPRLGKRTQQTFSLASGEEWQCVCGRHSGVYSPNPCDPWHSGADRKRDSLR